MKKILHIVFAVLIIITNCKKIDAQIWTKKTDFPGTARHSAYCFSINNKIYLGGGTSSSGIKESDFYEYNLSTGLWTKKAGMPIMTGMTDGIAFSINGKGYVGLGQATQSLKSLWEYNPTNDTWIPKAELPYFSGVYRNRVFVINNKAYVLVGTASNQVTQNDLYEYDPSSDSWTQKAPFPNNGRPDLPFAFAIGNKGYVACGLVQKSGGGTEYTKKMFEYDPTANTWTPKADFPGDARQMGVAFVLNGMGYCGLGLSKDANSNNISFDDFHMYDPVNNSWKSSIPFSGGKIRRSATAVADSIAFVGIGQTGSGVSNSWYQFSNSVDVLNINNQKTIKVFPNPSNGILSLLLEQGIEYTFTVYNSITGAKMGMGVVSNGDKIDITNLVSGQYVLELVSSKNNVSRALVTILH